jgi:hypothetical protein
MLAVPSCLRFDGRLKKYDLDSHQVLLHICNNYSLAKEAGFEPTPYGFGDRLTAVIVLFHVLTTSGICSKQNYCSD